jgi:membrane associated rhomboid family serine protease
MTQPFLRPRPYSRLPPVVMSLLIGNTVLFLLRSRYCFIMDYWMALWPLSGVAFQLPNGVLVAEFFPWQLVTYGFLHGNFTHLFFNMFALWMFGTQIENLWGSKAFLVYYGVCIVGAAVIQLAVMALGSQGAAATLGASGGMFGILLAYGMMFPNRQIMLLVPPIPIRAKYFVMIYGGVELYFGVSGMQSGVAHFAHLGGMLFGLILILYWRRVYPAHWR